MKLRGNNQAQLMISFYDQINEWTTNQLDINGKRMVSNFLMFYYRYLQKKKTIYIKTSKSY